MNDVLHNCEDFRIKYFFRSHQGGPSHVATKTFQALRIFVNDELNELHNGLTITNRLLSRGGVCVIISFHSLEDRLVKRHFQGINVHEKHNLTKRGHKMKDKVPRENLWNPINTHVTLPTDDEVFHNPRARSSKLRSAVKS